MKIEIEITEEQAAYIYCNRTKGGKSPRRLSEIVAEIAVEEANEWAAYFPGRVAKAVDILRRGND